MERTRAREREGTLRNRRRSRDFLMTVFCDLPRIADIQLCRNKKENMAIFRMVFSTGVEINVSDGERAGAKDFI
jgi:hypothetical protein